MIATTRSISNTAGIGYHKMLQLRAINYLMRDKGSSNIWIKYSCCSHPRSVEHCDMHLILYLALECTADHGCVLSELLHVQRRRSVR